MTLPYRSLPIAACLMLAGCAVGRRESDGAIILGFDVAKLPETPQQFLGAASGFLPEPWGSLAVGAGTLIFGGGAVGAMARRSKQREDAAFDEGVSRATPAAPLPPVAALPNPQGGGHAGPGPTRSEPR